MNIHGMIWFSRIGLIVAAVTATLGGGAIAAQTAVKFTLDSKYEGPTAPFLVGLDRGYYKAEELNVTIDEAADPIESISRVASGAYDLGFADINLLIKFRDQNPAAPIKAVFMVYNKPAFAIVGRKSRGVILPKDLEGKKLGAPAADSAYAYWKIFAQANSINSAKVEIENIGFPVREPMLQNGQVDAITGLSFAVLPNLKSMGVPANDIVVLLMADHGVTLYGNAIIVNPKFAAEKPEAVKAFLRAFLKGLKDTVKNPTRTFDSVLKRNDATKKDVELERLHMILRENVLTHEVKAHGYGDVDPARLDKAIEQIALTYEFKTKPKAADIFNASFLPAAALRKAN